ncbi:MAG: hypothetical protein IIA87_02170 [Nanoarchaeota archaeon]|nr:hypothetical protein [Nanoarchaeota archaeon]
MKRGIKSFYLFSIIAVVVLISVSVSIASNADKERDSPANPLLVSSETSGFGNVPVGTVQPWLKSFTGTPTLPDGWVEANGQNLSDPDSPYNGLILPNLNGESRFLRGSTTSGTEGGSETHQHVLFRGNWGTASHTAGELVTDTTGTAATASGDLNTRSSSTLPSYHEVVWIIKVKDNTGGLMGLVGVNETDQTFTSDAENVSNIALGDSTGIDAVLYEAWGSIGLSSLDYGWNIEVHDCNHNILDSITVNVMAGTGSDNSNEIPYFVSGYDTTPDTCALGYHLNLDEIIGTSPANVNFAKLTKIMA